MYKTIIRIVLVATLHQFCICLSYSQSSEFIANEDATIVFIRDSGFNASLKKFPIYVDDTELCKIKNGRYTEHSIPSGKHTFYARGYRTKKSKSENAGKVILDIESGETYYFQISFKQKLLTGFQVSCLEVTKSTANKLIKNCTHQKDCSDI